MQSPKRGFTLIELSIVLVIIGLIVGGILVGRDLIRASQLRGLISELEEFKSATNTFRLKYGQLPGDIHIRTTAQLGFFTFTGTNAASQFGNGNNDGIIQAGSFLEGYCVAEGSIFFHHLSQANLIKFSGQANLQTDTTFGYGGAPADEFLSTPLTLSRYLPESKIGAAYYCAGELRAALQFYAFSTHGLIDKYRNTFNLRGSNRSAASGGNSYFEPSMSPIELYNVELKADDGKPLQGKIINISYDFYTYTHPYWGAAASSAVCSFGGASENDIAQTYNANPSTGGNSITCQPIFIW